MATLTPVMRSVTMSALEKGACRSKNGEVSIAFASPLIERQDREDEEHRRDEQKPVLGLVQLLDPEEDR